MAEKKTNGTTMPKSTKSVSTTAATPITDKPKTPQRKAKVVGSRAMLPGTLGLPNTYLITKGGIHINSDEYLLKPKHPLPRVCAHCGSFNCVIKDDGYDQTIKHTPHNSRGTMLTFHRDRYLCKDCGKTCYQQTDLVQPGMQISRHLFISIIMDLAEKLSISQICQRYMVSTSVIYKAMEIATPQPSLILPETLCIDEFKGDAAFKDPKSGKVKHPKYQCNIANGDRGSIYDILPEATFSELRNYFKKYPLEIRKKVLFYCCDMRPGFIKLAKVMFPNAKICIDPFHVIRCVESALDDLRRDTQNAYLRNDDQVRYKALKGTYHLLHTKVSNQEKYWGGKKEKNLDKLNTAFTIAPKLGIIYNALQELHVIMDNPKYAQQREGFDAWCMKYHDSEVAYLRRAVETLHEHREYILNAWKFHKSNATAEGLNNTVKVIKRLSYGIPRFETLRSRCLLILGDTRFEYSSYTIFGEKSTPPDKPD